MEYTHFDKHGNAVMVDVSEKAVTKRVAVAKGSIRMSRECFDKIKYQHMKKEMCWGSLYCRHYGSKENFRINSFMSYLKSYLCNS